ncbi:hypothetical protein MANI_005143 [Metarhizium anisopliae]
MPQGTVSELEEFRVPGTEALEARFMKYLEGENYAWLRVHWIPKLLEIAGEEKPAIGVAMHIVGTLAHLHREGSLMKEKPLAHNALHKMYATQDLELFGVFFESKEVAEKAWKQLPPWVPGNLRWSAKLASAVLAPMDAEVTFTSRYSITAWRPEKELKHKESSIYGSSSCGRPRSRPSTAPLDQLSSFPSLNSTSFGIVNYSEDEEPNTVEGFSPCGPPASGPSTAPPGQLFTLPSINNTSFGIAHHSEDEESSTSSRPNPGGPTAVYGFDQIPFSSVSLPLAFTHPSLCDLPTPFADVPSSTSPGVSSYADTVKAKDERSSASNRSERPWVNFSVRMDGEPLVDDDGVVFETPGLRNRGAA